MKNPILVGLESFQRWGGIFHLVRQEYNCELHEQSSQKTTKGIDDFYSLHTQ
jgi:hypothetical protein